MLYVTGDTHGNHSIGKLSTECFPQQNFLTRNNYVIIAGDFGLVFKGNSAEAQMLDWLQEKNFTTLFVDGNHENFGLLNSYPVEEWHGGKVHKIRPNVIHLMRGQVFTICGKTVFTFGGAKSIDKMYRTEGISWWPEELPSHAEQEEGLANLDKVDWKVDYVITHGCSSEDHSAILAKHGLVEYDEYDTINKYLSEVKSRLTYKQWFCGHYHFDEVVNGVNFLYNNIVKVES